MSEDLVFNCKMCGQCCRGEGGIIVVQEEIEHICKYLNIPEQVFISEYLIKDVCGKYSIKINKHGYCIFFDTKKGCKIHVVKPNICRAWPFFKGNLEDVISFEMAKEYCPGINKDIGFDEFKKYGYRFLRQNGLITLCKNGPNALTISGK